MAQQNHGARRSSRGPAPARSRGPRGHRLGRGSMLRCDSRLAPHQHRATSPARQPTTGPPCSWHEPASTVGTQSCSAPEATASSCSAPNSAAAGTRSATISCAPSSLCEPSANLRPSGQPPFLAGAAAGGRSSPVRSSVQQPARCWAGCGWLRLKPPAPRPLWQPCWTGLTLQPSAACRCASCLTRFTRSRATEPGWRIVAAMGRDGWVILGKKRL